MTKVTKVVPDNSSFSDSAAEDNQKYESDEESYGKVQKMKKRPFICRIFLSVRLFLILVIMSLVILTSFSIWITSYKVNEEQAVSSVQVLIINIREKVSNFLNSQLLPAKQVAQQMAHDYHNNYISVDNSLVRYELAKVNVFNVTLACMCFGESGLNALQTVTIEESRNVMVWALKNPGENFTTNVIDRVTGEKIRFFGLTAPVYTIAKQDFYIESLNLFKIYPGGAFGKAYKVIGSSIQTFFSVPLFNRTDISQKQRIGISKVNISLKQIATFLSTVKVLDRGFVVVSESDTDYLIGTSLDVDLLYTRIPSVNLTSKGAGNIMKQFYAKSNKADEFQATVTENGKNYLVSSTMYSFENIKWRMTLVFEESEIMEGIIVSSYIILGVSIGVCALGIVISIVIGYIVTKPFERLQRDFRKIEILDLANIKPRTSIFTENSNIYSRLTNTVQWLRDFRSFLPDSVLNQLDKNSITKPSKSKFQPKESNYKTDISDSTHNISSHDNSETHSQSSNGRSKDSHKHHHDKKRDMFKLGLSVRECCVVNVKMNNMNEKHYPDSEVLSQTVSKVLTGISTICKTVKADLQIKSYDEFLVIFAERPQVSTIGLETALKIVQGIGHLNDNLSRNGHSKLSLSIGVASGDSLQGNVGNKQTRYFALVGTVIERARDLCFMSSQYETPVLADQITHKHGKHFIFRPVDRYLDTTSPNTPNILTIYELVKKNVVEQDEWLYELEQKKQNTRYQTYSDNFDRLFGQSETPKEEELDAIRDNLITISQQSPSDRVARRMSNLCKHHSHFLNYHSGVSKVIRSFLDMDQETPIHIE